MKKPRIGILYESRLGRNDGFPLYAKHVLDQMVLNGEIAEVVHLVPNGDYKDFGKFDLWFWPDFGEDALFDAGMLPYSPVLPTDGTPIAYFASDTHLDKGYRFSMAKKMDYVFFGQKRAVEEYTPSKKNKSVQWLPHAFEPECYRPGVFTDEKWIDAIPEKQYDICFVGHMQSYENYNGITRLDFLDEMFKEFPNFYFGTRMPGDPGHNLFDDASSKFNASRVVLNITAKDDINMRQFESMGSKSFVLTNWLPTYKDLFGEDFEGKLFVTYNTIEEAKEKAHYYLDHPEEREQIAEQAYQWAIKHDTYRHRMIEVLKTAGLWALQPDSDSAQ